MPGLAETAGTGGRSMMAGATGVDESLFGGQTSKKTTSKMSNVLIVGKDTIQKDRSKPQGPAQVMVCYFSSN